MAWSEVPLHGLESGVATGVPEAISNSTSWHATISVSGLTAQAMREPPAVDRSEANSGQLPSRRKPAQPSSQTMRQGCLSPGTSPGGGSRAENAGSPGKAGARPKGKGNHRNVR